MAYDRHKDELKEAIKAGIRDFLATTRGAYMFGSKVELKDEGDTVKVNTPGGVMFTIEVKD